MYHGRFKGTHYEAGYKYGSMLKAHGVIITKSPTFDITEEMKDFSAQCLKEYETYYPEVLSEIRGMADGQGSSFEVLCRILFCIYCFKPEQHCTCFAFSDKKNVIFARNSDFLVSLEKLYMNCLYALTDAYAFNANTTAFIQMEDGINEHGLAIGLTFCYPHIRKPGLNAGMLLRFLLERCKTTAEAINALHALSIASAQTFTIADAKGNIAVVECNPECFEVVYPKDNENFVVSANNFNSNALKAFRTPNGVDDWSADERFCTASKALKENNGGCSPEFAQRILSGEFGFICQYDRKKNADTVWSVVYDIKNRKVYRAEGNPSRKAFKEDLRMKFADEKKV